MVFIVYKIQNVLSGKSYIGYTNKPESSIRFQEHCNAAQRGSMFAIHAAIRKHGEAAWLITDLWAGDCELLAKETEIAFIESFNSISPNGYNMTKGGDGFRGLSRSEAHKSAISVALTGRSLAETTKEKLRQYKGEKASFYGKKQSEKWKATISKIMTENHPMKGRLGDKHPCAKSYKFESPIGVIYEVTGLAEFARTNNLSHSALSLVASGKRPHHKGWKLHQTTDWPEPSLPPINLWNAPK